MTTPRRPRSIAAAAITAAFLGPGTITACSLAGIQQGYALLWVLLLSLLALLVAQEQCLQLGARRGVSLAEALAQTPSRVLRVLFVGLVAAAIGGGCAAYQAGNLNGAAQGLVMLTQVEPDVGFAVACLLATGLLLQHRTAWLLRVLVVLVVLMTVCFAAAAVLSRPPLAEVFAGLVRPRLPPGLHGETAFLSVAGLVGTTIVPYNLFLYSALVRDQVREGEEAGERRALWVFLPLGILISMLVVVTAAASFHGHADAPTELTFMVAGLERPLGGAGRVAFALGVFAAGLSSALTAPVAAGMAVSDLLPGAHPRVARGVRFTVLALGIASGFLKATPTQVIFFAQVTNALLLPISLAFLTATAARRGDRAHPPFSRGLAVAGALVTLASLLVAGRTFLVLLR